MAENVRVIVRCRPMNNKEITMKCNKIIKMDDYTVCIKNPNDTTAPNKSFTFDSVYNEKAPTEAIYNDICYPLIESVLDGFNATIFAYGQTGCGKSYTMQGPIDNLEKSISNDDSMILSSNQRGIISRSFEHIFEAISIATSTRFLAMVSYLEIYNENIRDLLNPNNIQSNNLQLKEIPNEGVIVQNLSSHVVHNPQECEKLLAMGSQNRIVGATQMNETSSRSHSIFTICLEQITDTTDFPTIKRGKLNLVDLAGSERQAKTGAIGERLKEATKINLSLSALGNVISALVDGKSKHIPYRDSKLTRLLQDSLGGNTKTLMIACISPATYNYDETLSTLRYANRAKNISNEPILNEDPKDTMLREYKEEILKLKNLLTGHGVMSDVNIITSSNNINWIENEKEKIRNEYEKRTEKLKLMHDTEQKEKENLVKDMEKLKIFYENRLQIQNNNNDNNIKENGEIIINQENSQLNPDEIIKRIKIMKSALIGGEKAFDVHLKEKRYKKKLAVQKRQNALAQALSRLEQTEERDILQEHYIDIQQELQIKTEALKVRRHKIRSLQREIADLQAEFQLDRSDYLETIRRLEKNMKFYQQLLGKALPLLRKEGRFWDMDVIKANSDWNDDLQKWKIPEDLMTRLRLPPAVDVTDSGNVYNNGRESTSLTAPGRLERGISESAPSSPSPLSNEAEPDFLMKKLQRSDGESIAETYFRPRRAAELIHNKTKGFHKNWQHMNEGLINVDVGGNINGNARHIAWLSAATDAKMISLSKTWCDGLSSSNSLISSPPLQSLSSSTQLAATHNNMLRIVNNK